MATLRKTVQLEILDILNNSIFTADDFEVIFGDSKKKEPMIYIKFISAPDYIYAIVRSEDEGLIVTRKPGEIEDIEREEYDELSEALSGINDWCKEVRNELKASQPLYNEVDKLRNIIEEHIKGNSEAEEFSVEEIFVLRKKFEDLESRVTSLERDKIITETQTAEFKSGIKQVKEDLEFYPKKTWVRTATNKLVKIVMTLGKSKEGRALLEDGARKLIGLE